MTAGIRVFEDVTVGEPLPVLEKEIRLADMMAYGAATWDFARIHYDDASTLGSRACPHPLSTVRCWALSWPSSCRTGLGLKASSEASTSKIEAWSSPATFLPAAATSLTSDGRVRATWWSAASGLTTRRAKGWSGRPPPPSASQPETNPNDDQAHNQARPLPVGPQLRG